MENVYTAMNPTDAHLVRGLLESEGIEAVVQGEFLWTALLQFLVFTSVHEHLSASFHQ